MKKTDGKTLNKWRIYLVISFEGLNLIIPFCRKNKVQDLNINQLKLEVHDSYKKDEKIPTKFEPIDNEDITNKAYLDEKISKIRGWFSDFEKHYNEVKLI